MLLLVGLNNDSSLNYWLTQAEQCSQTYEQVTDNYTDYAWDESHLYILDAIQGTVCNIGFFFLEMCYINRLASKSRTKLMFVHS